MIKFPVFLIGFMASAKSTIGRKMANRMNCEFIDLDEYIESKEGKSISKIFSKKGESFFRKIESEALKEVAEKKAVIALGGGAFISFENRTLIKASGQSVFLDVTPSVLIGRLKKERSKRPLIADLNNVELSDFVRKTLEERRSFYEEADFIVKTNKPTIKEILMLLEKEVG